jgi:rod shape-determining protein MreC
LIGLTVFLALNTNKLPVVSNMFNNINTILKTNEENKILKSRFERYEQQVATKQLLEQENKILKDIIKATETLKNQGYNPIQGTVISRDMTNKDNFLTISKGQKEGIKKNMIVLSTDGVIGRVVEVDTNSSEVQLLSGEDARVNSVAATLKENKKVLE